MSRAMADTPSKRPRRQFTDEFKASAVRLVLDEEDGRRRRARPRLTETALREWVKRGRADRTHGRTDLTTSEREELTRLRKENRILQEEREVLEKATPSSRSRAGKTGRYRTRPPVSRITVSS